MLYIHLIVYVNGIPGANAAATRGPLETTTKIVPGAVTFQNTEAMTKVRHRLFINSPY